jgi:hypothetical protein
MLDPKQREWVRKMAGLVTHNLADSPVGAGEDGAGGSGGGLDSKKKDAKAPATDSTCHADLPQPMLPDCKVVKGAIPGPDNFKLCSMHGHILDTAANEIVANNLKEFLAQHPEYQKLPMDMLEDCAAERGKLKGPAHHVLCSTHGHVLDIKAKKVIAYSTADYRKRFAPKKDKAPAESETQSPPYNEKEAQEKLRNILSGAAIFINDFQGRKSEFDKEMDKMADLCPDAVSEARTAMTEAIAALRAHNVTAGEWIARSDLWVPGDIPGKSQEARNALSKFSSAMDKLRKCLDKPPPPPDPGPPPRDVDPDALKAQRELVRRRDRMDALRAFEGNLKSLAELGVKIEHELEKAKNLAKRMQVGR